MSNCLSFDYIVSLMYYMANMILGYVVVSHLPYWMVEQMELLHFHFVGCPISSGSKPQFNSIVSVRLYVKTSMSLEPTIGLNKTFSIC